MKTEQDIKARISKLSMDVIEYGSMHCDALERFKDGAITPFTCRQCADEIDRAVLQKKKAESEIKALRWMLIS